MPSSLPLAITSCLDDKPYDPEDGSGYEGIDEDNDSNTVTDS
ncbi:MAG: hypothetical protein SFX73_30805 [Kofleriaceae bacterium]|nr:hypothetical protein [Kofleriaceae bacterium]